MNFLRRINFNFWYFGRPPWDTGISPPELFDFISKHAAGRAIDLGCGTGTNVITLAQNGWQVTGIDFAPRAIQTAKRKMKAAHVRADARVGDVTKLNGVDGPFDLALDLGCFHGVDKRPDYLTVLQRVLAPSGYWLMYGIFKSPGFGHGLDEADIELIRASGFRLLSRSDGVDRRQRPSAWFLFQKAL
ncbi:MAG TPA: class I SAM-dependent methyltransferase [Anaerolineales bacterium]|nr:class I SAM-dependent methyltransferase [Anaerolineales bacterium]